jgi:hypothetical protein
MNSEEDQIEYERIKSKIGRYYLSFVALAVTIELISNLGGEAPFQTVSIVMAVLLWLLIIASFLISPKFTVLGFVPL